MYLQKLRKSTLSRCDEKRKNLNQNESIPWKYSLTKPPLANFLIYVFKQLRVSIPGRVSSRSSKLFQPSRYKQFLLYLLGDCSTKIGGRIKE